MDEFKFVMKCLIFAALILSLSQFKTDGITLESRVQSYLVSSNVAEFVNESAHGAVKFIKKATNDISSQMNRFLHQPEKAKKQSRESSQIKSEDIDLSK